MQSKLFSVMIVPIVLLFIICDATAAQVSISNVTIKNSLFNPTAGEQAQISFYLSRDAGVAVTIFDAEDSPVGAPVTVKPGYQGINTVSWDGKDTQGSIVADDAYYFVIEAKDNEGFTAIYDPASFSGGEKLPVEAVYRSKHITYHLSRDGRVRIRIGAKNGPLLRTLLDWAPRRAGPHAEPWDGMDDAGAVRVQELPFIVMIEAAALPQHSLITTGSGQNLSASVERTPRFQISINNSAAAQRLQTSGIPTVSGEVALTVNLEELTGLQLANQRYEILVFVDQEFLMEDEQGYQPYTFRLDSRQLTNGQHVVTFNVATLTGQVGSSSIVINVQNE